ncbi:hypothetical protein STRTUCAR8_00999, partial [Streptomyces turgidiscabies Car8]
MPGHDDRVPGPCRRVPADGSERAGFVGSSARPLPPQQHRAAQRHWCGAVAGSGGGLSQHAQGLAGPVLGAPFGDEQGLR